MTIPNRRIVQAKEESANALRRSAAAKKQIAVGLRDLLSDDEEQVQKLIPLPPKIPTPSKNHPRKK